MCLRGGKAAKEKDDFTQNTTKKSQDLGCRERKETGTGGKKIYVEIRTLPMGCVWEKENKMSQKGTQDEGGRGGGRKGNTGRKKKPRETGEKRRTV